MALPPDPPWLDLLNALQSEWRVAEILKDRNPDPYLEGRLRAMGVWPPKAESASLKHGADILRQHVAVDDFHLLGNA
jgi:hypothetical protein